jgi:hypothetical protein
LNRSNEVRCFFEGRPTSSDEDVDVDVVDVDISSSFFRNDEKMVEYDQLLCFSQITDKHAMIPANFEAKLQIFKFIVFREHVSLFFQCKQSIDMLVM